MDWYILFLIFIFILQHGLMTQLLRLAYNCLTFDFIGTSTDESSDDLCTVQIPTSWRPAFLDYSTLKLFFDLYHSLPNTLSPLVSTYFQSAGSVGILNVIVCNNTVVFSYMFLFILPFVC